MFKDMAIRVSNYKCFRNEEQGFEKIFPVNIIVGKNNSGKSSLLDLIHYVTDPTGGHLNIAPEQGKCIIEFLISEAIINRVIELYSASQGTSLESWDKLIRELWKSNFHDQLLRFELKNDALVYYEGPDIAYGQYHDTFHVVYNSIFKKKVFKRITAERDVTREPLYPKESFAEGGKGATPLIWKYLAVEGFDSSLIKKEFLTALNCITKPDIEFQDITVKEEATDQRSSARGEIYFVNAHGKSIALSKMGSGVKTIILVLLNLLVVPASEYKKHSEYFFAFEELENNLHPSLQRRLFNYIADFARSMSCHFFITTHSSIVIDQFSKNPDAQILHLDNSGKQAIVRTISSIWDGKAILKDLDYKASDLLLSNGIIWVEGPSDAIYLELMIDLLKETDESFEKFSYSIQTLSTAIWKYAGFDDLHWDQVDEEIEHKIIMLSNINHNHLIILDRDHNYEDLPPSHFNQFEDGTGKNKARLLFESLKSARQSEDDLLNNYGDRKDGQLSFWVNEGTVETYLEYFIANRGADFSKYFAESSERGYIEKKRVGENHSISKVKLASKIARMVQQDGLLIEDIAPQDSSFRKKLNGLFNTVKGWNI